MPDLLGLESAIDSHTLYACHDLLLEHKQALFDHLIGRWRDLFNVSFDVLLYDLTSTYFEIDPPLEDEDKRRHSYSRDHRLDCVQVVIALVITPQGFPLSYEVLAGNTHDNATLKDFLAHIEGQYGKARRVWLMDRGVPTEEVLEQMRSSDPPVQYVVGTPKGRLTKLERALMEKPRKQSRADVRAKLLAQDAELYVFAESHDRIAKERAMRRRQLKWLWARRCSMRWGRAGSTPQHETLAPSRGGSNAYYPRTRQAEGRLNRRHAPACAAPPPSPRWVRAPATVNLLRAV